MATKDFKESKEEEKSFEKDKCRVKIICLGDSAVGKSKLYVLDDVSTTPTAAVIVRTEKENLKNKTRLGNRSMVLFFRPDDDSSCWSCRNVHQLVERFLLDGYKPQQLSTYALQLFRYETKLDNEPILVEFWDTAGQEMFQSMHPSFYHEAHCCILVFDVTRKVTYKNLPNWLKELREFRPNIPVLCVANKIDANAEATQKSYAFPQKNNLPFYYVSASNGTNVVRLFKDAIQSAVNAKKNSKDITDQILEELERF